MSYAIVDVSGLQCRIEADEVVRVPKMDAEVGATVTIDKVLLISDGKKVEIGKPHLEGKQAKAEVVRHGRDDKVIVFKKKRRKKYRRTLGHRQGFTEIRIKALPK